MLTSIRIVNLEGHKYKRTIELANIKAITKNTKEGHTDDFVVHVSNEYDYRFWSEDRDMIIKHIVDEIRRIKGELTPIYAVCGQMGDYVTTEEGRLKGFAKGLPPEEYRLTGEVAVTGRYSTTDTMFKWEWSDSSRPVPEKKSGLLK